MGSCIANCAYCGVSFDVFPHELKQKNIFCCEKHAAKKAIGFYRQCSPAFLFQGECCIEKQFGSSREA